MNTKWRVRHTEVHGKRYGLRDVAVADRDDMLLIEGSGNARSYTETVCTFPGSVDDEKHARLIAAAPEMLAALLAAQEWFDAHGGHHLAVNNAIAKAGA